MAYRFDERFLARPTVREVDEVQITTEQEELLDQLIAFIWENEDAKPIKRDFLELVKAAQERIEAHADEGGEIWSEKQLVFICYGDHIRSRDPGTTPLRALRDFVAEYLPEEVFSETTMHLLPIYESPYRDGGFDVADPFSVNPKMGDWDDVRALREESLVAVDFVANHLSIDAPWFKAYLSDDPEYRDFFIGFDDERVVAAFEKNHLPKIYRPRPHNPLIPVKRPDGSTRWVYMTFSDHQADVNFAVPFVFLKMAEILLFYFIQGATVVRLDAIPYLWKEWGTDCAHHPRTHALVQLFRLASDLANPASILLAESMEPLADSRRYLSSETELKAQMAYNFAPCGLIPHAHINGDARAFQNNVEFFAPPGNRTAWAVVCGVTHDSSSMNPCRAPKSEEGEALLSEDQINQVAEYFTSHGYEEIERRSALPDTDPEHMAAGYIERFEAKHGEKPRFMNFKRITDAEGNARNIVYEAASAYGSLFDKDPDRIVSALGMALALPGIPFYYLTTVFAVMNDFDYYYETGNPRELNRGRVMLEDLREKLADTNSLTHAVFDRMKRMLLVRLSHPAFHPGGLIRQVKNDNDAVVSFVRADLAGQRWVLVAHNVAPAEQRIRFEVDIPELKVIHGGTDLLSDIEVSARERVFTVTLPPYTIAWLELA